MGAWIETALTVMSESGNIVAPYVGAWIETNSSQVYKPAVLSHPTWVRGLKLNNWDNEPKTNRRTLRGCVD